jgi:hypothetical protein
MKHLLCSVLDGHDSELGRCQSTTDNHNVHILALPHLCCHRGVWKLTDLHGMAACLTSLVQPDGWYVWRVAWTYCKHDTSSVMHSLALVRTDCKDFIRVGHCSHDTVVDVFNTLLSYEVPPEPVSVNHALAIVSEQCAARCIVVLTFSLIDGYRWFGSACRRQLQQVGKHELITLESCI